MHTTRILKIIWTAAALAAAAVATLARPAGAAEEPAVPFVANAGQADPAVRYMAMGPDYGLYFTDTEARYAFARGQERGPALALRFVDANPRPRIEGRRPHGSRSSVTRGNDPAGRRTGLPTFEEIVYRDLWPGVDLVFKTAGGAVKYDLLVGPGAELDRVRFAYRGAELVWLDADGNLRVVTPLGTLTDRRPVAYQTVDERQVPVESDYLLESPREGESRFGFAVGAGYHAQHPLVIGPTLVFSTVVGSGQSRFAHAVAAHRRRNAHVVGGVNAFMFGHTLSPAF
jgi:hypothetical protein